MKKLLLLIFGFLCSLSYAQRHEIGIFAGGANVIGDIGKDNYINPLPVSYFTQERVGRAPIALGGIYRFNFNPYMGLRLNALYGKVIGSDYTTVDKYKKERDYTFINNIIEGSLIFEYNFFSINDFDGSKHSPYIFMGLGAFMYDKMLYEVNHSFTRNEQGVILNPPTIYTEIETIKEKETKFTIPFGAGYKYKYRNFVISAEVGFRYTKTDNLDYSFSNEKDFTFNVEPGLDLDQVETLNSNIIKSRQVGNTSNYDWYVFTGLTLTYTFGRPPCYCN